ncbi:MAG: hypothetical protein BWX92_04089 [Deltaproteobacteria bacterium ADurb.Bin135]|nr:MAG: hypothetical protein BWX92_04089 [Deltaproteobacteria bacterium ADurb.Bin135]
MFVLDCSEEIEKIFFFLVSDSVTEPSVEFSTFLLKINSGPDCLQVVIIACSRLIHLLQKLRQNLFYVCFLYYQRQGFRPDSFLLPLYFKLFETLVMLKLIVSDLFKHGLTKGIFCPFSIFEIEFSLLHLIIEGNF